MKLFISGIFILISALTLASGHIHTDTDPIVQNSDTINQYVDNKKHGYWIIYAHMRNEPDYKPNDVIEEGRFKMNRKHGLWKKYFPSGKKQSEITFKNGKAYGQFATYYDNPENTPEEQGNWGGKIYKDSYKRYYEDGTIAQEKFFNEQGKTEGKQVYYHSNGQIELEFETKNGKETGTATRYWPNGDVKEIITFDAEGNGTSQGEVPRVNPPVDLNPEEEEEGEGIAVEGDQNPAEQTSSGIVDGYHKTYNDNKDILMDGEFKKGKLWNGKHYIYDEYGLLEKIEVYKKGKFVGNGVIE